MKEKYWRLLYIVLAILGLGAAAAMVLMALSQNISYYRTPSDVLDGKVVTDIKGRNFRLGGLVEKGSLQRDADQITIHFRVTDNKNSLPITFKGLPPDLFREGQGVIAEGRMQDGVFIAHRLLAKHDENYKPPAGYEK